MQSATTTSTQKTNGHAPAGVRLCKCGCGATVPATNRFNFIRGHMKRKSAKRGSRGPYNTKKRAKEPRSEAVPPVLAIPAPSASAERQAELPRVALQVTEAQLDQYFVKLPFEDKQWLANRYLREFHL